MLLVGTGRSSPKAQVFLLGVLVLNFLAAAFSLSLCHPRQSVQRVEACCFRVNRVPF